MSVAEAGMARVGRPRVPVQGHVRSAAAVATPQTRRLPGLMTSLCYRRMMPCAAGRSEAPLPRSSPAGGSHRVASIGAGEPSRNP